MIDLAVESEVISPWRQCTPVSGSIGQRSTAMMAGEDVLLVAVVADVVDDVS